MERQLFWYQGSSYGYPEALLPEAQSLESQEGDPQGSLTGTLKFGMDSVLGTHPPSLGGRDGVFGGAVSFELVAKACRLTQTFGPGLTGQLLICSAGTKSSSSS